MKNATTIHNLLFGMAMAIIALTGNSLYAADGDVTQIPLITSKRFPGTPTNIDAPVILPQGKSFARILLKAKLECPCSKGKGEWDYTVNFSLKVKTGVDKDGKPVYNDNEIARFITPYAANRPSNWNYTWSWDVTDYTFMMKDSVLFSAGYSGYTESALFTVWLECIEGTPPYETYAMDKLWQGYFPYGKESDPIDNYITNKKFLSRTDAKYVKLRIIATGHGGGGTENAAEFVNKTHKIWINDTERFTQHLWRDDCGFNAVYPQDGTWSLQRAGWCPGDVVQYWDWEITNYVNKSDSTKIDYKMQAFTNFEYNAHPSGYGVMGQVMYAKNPNFSNNATIEGIVAPNNAAPYNRTNPICGNPVIHIRNHGREALTSLTFEYGVRGGTMRTYQWTGNLAFMEDQNVTLPSIEWGNSFAPDVTERVFEVKISNPNGKADEYALWNSASSTFNVPPSYYNAFVINMKPNKEARNQGFFWELRNAAGELIAERRDMDDLTQYNDPVDLEDGCYLFRLVNPSSYGLAWWFSEAAGLGSGSLSFSKNSRTLRDFNGDFGNEIYHQFRVENQPTILVSRDTIHFGVVPVGDSAIRTVVVRPQNRAGLKVTGASLTALPTSKGFSLVSTVPSIPVNGSVTLAEKDSLIVTLQYKPTVEGRKTATTRISSNDFFDAVVSLPIVGGVPPGGTSDVSDEGASDQLSLQVLPSVADERTSVQFSFDGGAACHVRCTLINTLGQEVRVLHNATMHPAEKQQVSVPTGTLAQGMYIVLLQSGNTSIQVPLVVTH